MLQKIRRDPHRTPSAFPGGSTRKLRFEPVLFFSLLLVNLAPIWSVSYLPTQDGAAHLYNADIIRTYFLPSEAREREFYQLVVKPVPNLLGHILMAILLCAVPPTVAEKLTASLYIVMLPLAARYAIGAVRSESRFLSNLIFPLVYSRLHNYGFYNFNLGLGLFFLIVGYWFKHRTQLTKPRLAALGGMCLLLGLTHLVPVLAVLAVVGSLEIWLAFLEMRSLAPGDPRRKTITTRLAWVCAAPILLAAFAVYYRVRTGATQSVYSLSEMLDRMAKLEVLVSYQAREVWGSIAFAILLAVLTAYELWRKIRRSDWSGWDVLLVVAVLFVAMFFEARDSTAARFFLAERLCLFAIFVLILWLAAQHYDTVVRVVVPVAAAAITVFLLALHLQSYLQLNPYVREYVSVADQIPANSTFLPIVFHPEVLDENGKPISLHVCPLLHTSGYIAVLSRAIDLSNYEAHTRIFPIRFRKGLDTLAIMPELTQTNPDDPPIAKIHDYEVTTGQPIDYVLLCGCTPADAARPEVRDSMADLAREYRLVYTSTPKRLVQLYQRREK
jgi:hypothetical protein